MSTWQSNLIQIGETGDQLYSGITKYVFSDSFVHCFFARDCKSGSCHLNKYLYLLYPMCEKVGT